MELATPGSAIKLASVERHATYCATWLGDIVVVVVVVVVYVLLVLLF